MTPALFSPRFLSESYKPFVPLRAYFYRILSTPPLLLLLILFPKEVFILSLLPISNLLIYPLGSAETSVPGVGMMVDIDCALCTHVEVREQFGSTGSLFPPLCIFWGLNSSHQAIYLYPLSQGFAGSSLQIPPVPTPMSSLTTFNLCRTYMFPP